MVIKVLAFATSPRRHGNSETALDWLLADMGKEKGVSVEKIVLEEADIHPCRGCNACEVLNRCVQRDGMDVIHDKLIEADCIVLASPIYCMGICAQAKALVDRAQVFRSRKYVLRLPVVPPERKGKRLGVFIATAGQMWENVFNGAIPSVKCFFHVIEVRDEDIRPLLFRGVDEKGAIERHPTAHEETSVMAREIIATLRKRLGE